jgi:hypothetical protein
VNPGERGADGGPASAVRGAPLLLAPFAELGRQFADMLNNPAAFFGALGGSALLTAGIAALLLFGPTFEDPPDDGGELEMVFLAGELVRLGEKLDPQEIPEKPVIPDTVATPDSAPSTVTDDDREQADVKKPDNSKKNDSKSLEKPDPNKQGAQESDRNRDANTPYKDPKTADRLPGDPFGEAGGWSDTFKAGDPWATEVMKVLNNLEVGVYAGESKGGTYKFRLEVCPDGKLKAQRKQSTGDTTLDGAIEAEIARKKVPVPKNVGDLLGGKCQKIKYEFTWQGTSGGRGNVQ